MTDGTMQFAATDGTAGPVDNPVLLMSADGLTLSDYFAYESPILDVRAFQSFSMFLTLQGGTFTNTDLALVSLDFYADPSGTYESKGFSDEYTLYKTNILGSLPFRITDVVHGAYMQLSVTDIISVGRSVQLSYQLYGSYRQAPGTSVRVAPNGVVYEQRASLAASGTNAQPAYLGVGRAMASLASGAAGGATMWIDYGSNGGSVVQRYELKATAANTRVTREILMPKQQGRVTLKNDATATQTIEGFIIQEVPAA